MRKIFSLFIMFSFLCGCGNSAEAEQENFTELIKGKFPDYTLNTYYFSVRPSDAITFNDKIITVNYSYNSDSFFNRESKSTRTGEVIFFKLNYSSLTKEQQVSTISISANGGGYSTSITQQITLQGYKNYLGYILHQDDRGLSEITIQQNSEDSFVAQSKTESSGGMEIKANIFTLEGKLYTFKHLYSRYKLINNRRELIKHTENNFEYYFGENPYVDGLQQGKIFLNEASIDESLLDPDDYETRAVNGFKQLNSLYRSKGDTELVTSIS